jgi:molybdate transport system permease protein
VDALDALFRAWPAFRLTLQVGTLATLIFLILGVPLAWVLVRKEFLGKRLLETLVLLPLVLPPTVLGYYLLLLLGQNGPMAQAFGISWAFRFEGVVVGSVLFSTPFVLTAYREAFRGLDEDLLQTARTLGAGRFRVWREVILPLTWPGILSGSILAFAHAIGEFGVILMIGGAIPGKTQVVSIYIYDLVQALRFAEANIVALTLLAISFVLVYVVRTIEARWKLITN